MNIRWIPGFCAARRRSEELWRALERRERLLLGSALALLAAVLLWYVTLAPALDTLRKARTQHGRLDAELFALRLLAAEAAELQALPRVTAAQSRQALELSVKQRFGAAAQLSAAGERTTLTLTGATAQAIGGWLSEARSNARVLPAEARLRRNPAGTGWDGTLVLSLPLTD